MPWIKSHRSENTTCSDPTDGAVALLTDGEAKQIQVRIDALTTDDLEPPYYIYETDSSSTAGINETLDEEAESRSEEKP